MVLSAFKKNKAIKKDTRNSLLWLRHDDLWGFLFSWNF